MVHCCRGYNPTFLLASHTERMLPEIGGTGLMPPRIITAFRGATPSGIIKMTGLGQMHRAKTAGVVSYIGTTIALAGASWLGRHFMSQEILAFVSHRVMGDFNHNSRNTVGWL